MSSWYAAHTHPGAEHKAAFHLARQGYDVYLPRYLKRRSHARRIDYVAAPLFPRYLFVHPGARDGQWRAIHSTVGVNHLICQGSLPVAVPDEIIACIRDHENERGLVRLMPAANIRPGEQVQVTGGPFSQCVGLFEDFKDSERVTLLLGLMGRQVKVSVNAEFVDRVQ